MLNYCVFCAVFIIIYSIVYSCWIAEVYEKKKQIELLKYKLKLSRVLCSYCSLWGIMNEEQKEGLLKHLELLNEERNPY